MQDFRNGISILDTRVTDVRAEQERLQRDDENHEGLFDLYKVEEALYRARLTLGSALTLQDFVTEAGRLYERACATATGGDSAAVAVKAAMSDVLRELRATLDDLSNILSHYEVK